MQQPFDVGDAVMDRRNTARGAGRVIRVDYDEFDQAWFFQVLFGTETLEKEAGDLIPADTQRDPWSDAANGILGPAQALRTLLTYARIKQPPGPVGQVFGTARATLYPYQFKPLVKFLDNPNNTLLIADEVGLGKTIEAGYIMKECKLRYDADAILIVVPARLRTKWKREMESRFMESFELVGAREVRDRLKKVRRGGELGSFQWIASYESLRRAEVIDALREVQPPLDLLILDEAHRVRNRGTRQYEVASALRQNANATLFLTATPIQTGTDNLYTLLDLLEDGRFGTTLDFERIINANRPIVQATRLAGAGHFSEAADRLDLVLGDELTGPDYRDMVSTLQSGLRANDDPSRAERVTMQSDIGELNLIGHVLTRTRKSDVMENRAKRRAQPVKVLLTEDERAVYEGVAEITRLIYGSGGWGQSMATLTAYRYVASSIPGGLQYLRDRLNSEGFGSLTDEVDSDLLSEEDDPVAGISGGVASRIRAILARCPTPAQDSKLQALLQALDTIWSEDAAVGRAPRKVVIFSFFKRTLHYLNEQLDNKGYGHEVIHGDVAISEREERIEVFLNRPSCNVLLSSEVGGEGLDLQKACVVVNYDLPWNPMVVEQRIGRVDRIGQASDTIVIVNLICEDTVEDRILARLYDRIAVFQAAIGEMEEILGPRDIQGLVLEYLSGKLTEEELEERVIQTADAALRYQEQAVRLDGEVDGILAADQAILDQLKSLVTGNRLPGPADTATLVKGFLEQHYPGVQFEGVDMDQGVCTIQMPVSARTDLQQYLQRTGNNALEVRRLVQGSVDVTTQGEVAMNHPRVLFLQSRHPLVQFAVESMEAKALADGCSFAVELEADDIESGIWLIGVWTLSREGAENETELVTVAAQLAENGQILVGDDAEPITRAVLRGAAELDPRPTLVASDVAATAERCKRALRHYRREMTHRVRDRVESRRIRRKAVWLSSLRQRVARMEQRVRENETNGAAGFTKRMNQAKLNKARERLKQLTEDLEVKQEVRVEASQLATIVAVVR